LDSKELTVSKEAERPNPTLRNIKEETFKVRPFKPTNLATTPIGPPPTPLPAQVDAFNFSAVSSADTELWKKWHSTRSPYDLEELIRHLDPLIQAQVNQRAGTLSRDMLVTQAKVLAVKAIKSYDPKYGVKLSTHVINQLQKLSRVNYAHQNAARIPEHTMLQFHSYNIAKEDFKAENGRDPTVHELSDSLKWSPRKVEQFQTQFGRAELLESIDTPTGMFVAAVHDPRVEYVYMSMSPRQQHIFEYATGYHGTERLSNADIMKKLKITQGVLSYEKNKIKEMLKDVV
jgi:hypothetical protein